MARGGEELLAGLVRLHVLHHAAEGELFGQWMIRELRHHGHDISPGTLYPMLHGLERKGYIRSRKVMAEGRRRRVYRITPAGRAALRGAKRKVRELFSELFAGEPEGRLPAPEARKARKRKMEVSHG